MNVERSFVRCATALRRAGEPLVLATVVRVAGSAYRRPGARMLVTGAGESAGAISAGCLERDVVARGLWHTRNRDVALVTYDSQSDEDDKSALGIGCDGVVDVLLEQVSTGQSLDPIAVLEAVLDQERSCAMVTVYQSRRFDLPLGTRLVRASDGTTQSSARDGAARGELLRAARQVLTTGKTEVLRSADGTYEALVEALEPPPHLFVFGSGPDASPVAAFAKALGWTVTVCDRQARFVTNERFLAADERRVLEAPAIAAALNACAHPLAVVVSHDYAYDRAILAALLPSRAEYIGVLGPRRRTERMLAEIEPHTGPIDACRHKRLHAPVGLDIGAETHVEVALAIVAEAKASLEGRSGGSLRERAGRIHPTMRVSCGDGQ